MLLDKKLHLYFRLEVVENKYQGDKTWGQLTLQFLAQAQTHLLYIEELLYHF
jgi:hypothetical protein